MIAQNRGGCQVETAAYFIGKIRPRAPAPGGGKKFAGVIVLKRRDRLVAYPNIRPIDRVPVPGERMSSSGSVSWSRSNQVYR